MLFLSVTEGFNRAITGDTLRTHLACNDITRAIAGALEAGELGEREGGYVVADTV